MNKIILIFYFFLHIGTIFSYAQIKKYETYYYPFNLSRDSLQKENLYEKSLNFYLDNFQEDEAQKYYYQIAVNYAFLSKIDSAYFYLDKYLDFSQDDRVVLVDYAFNNLKADSTKWQFIVSRIENDYLSSLPACCKNPTSMLSLFYLSIEKEKYRFYLPFLHLPDSLFNTIQEDGKEISFLKFTTPEVEQNREETTKSFLEILQKDGFPDYKCDGEFAEIVAYNILSDIVLEKNLYDSISDLFAQGKFNSNGYAYITDSWLRQRGKKQLYGTKYINKKKKDWDTYRKEAYPIKNIDEINMRRKCMNFTETIQQYAERKSITLPEKITKTSTTNISNKIVDGCIKTYETHPHTLFIVPKDSLQRVKNYRASIDNYLNPEDTTYNRIKYYRLATNYALLNDRDSAFYYIWKWLDISPDDRLLVVDKDFEILRADSLYWHKVINKIENNYLNCLSSSVNKDLALKLFYLGIEDQKYRVYLSALGQMEPDSSGRYFYYPTDENMNELEKIIKEYGYPTISMVGESGSTNAFLILQHSMKIKKYYPKAQKVFQQGEMNCRDFALLTDRYLLDRRKKQLYGTQIIKDRRTLRKYPDKHILAPVKDFENVNMRRRQMGFTTTVEQYVESWNDKNYIIPEKYYQKN